MWIWHKTFLKQDPKSFPKFDPHNIEGHPVQPYVPEKGTHPHPPGWS
jgi:hypothetical protein